MKKVKDYYPDPWGYGATAVGGARAQQQQQQQSLYGGGGVGGYDKWGFGGTYVNGYSRGYANGTAAIMPK